MMHAQKNTYVYEDIKLLHKYVLIQLIQYYQELYEKALKLGIQSICDSYFPPVENNLVIKIYNQMGYEFNSNNIEKDMEKLEEGHPLIFIQESLEDIEGLFWDDVFDDTEVDTDWIDQLVNEAIDHLEWGEPIAFDLSYIQKAKQQVMDYIGKNDQRMFVPKNYNYDEIVEMRKDLEPMDVVLSELERVELTEEQLKNQKKQWEILKEEAEAFGNDLTPGDEYETDKFEVPLYTICFSGHSDLLSQWRGYAKDGTGVAIGFKTKYLKKWKSGIFDKKAIMTAKFDQVNYKNFDMEHLL